MAIHLPENSNEQKYQYLVTHKYLSGDEWCTSQLSNKPDGLWEAYGSPPSLRHSKSQLFLGKKKLLLGVAFAKWSEYQ